MWEKARYRTVNEIIYFFEGGYNFKTSGKEDFFWHFKGILT